MREYIRGLLSKDYQCAVACDGIEALEMIKKGTPELLLTDIMMPKLDGYFGETVGC